VPLASPYEKLPRLPIVEKEKSKKKRSTSVENFPRQKLKTFSPHYRKYGIGYLESMAWGISRELSAVGKRKEKHFPYDCLRQFARDSEQKS